MPLTVLLCTDGSDLALEALRAGLAVLAPPERIVVATVIEPADPMLVTGTGMAGGVMSLEESQGLHDAHRATAQAVLDETCTALGLTGAETKVLEGGPGPSLCQLAGELPASVLVMGTRGRGGLRRAVLGSISDHVVRNAPCPVVVTTGSS
jgi:nucleotide-binding universal stress UspA family protein